MTRRAWLLFAGVCALWGIPYFFIKVAVAELAPPVVVIGRTGIAALVLLPLAIRSGAFKQLRGRLGPITLLALVHVAGPALLITYGEVHITSSLTALLIAAQPLFVGLLALRFDASERLSAKGFAGLGIGLLGVAVVVGLDFGMDRWGVLGAVLVLLAALGYAVATLIVKQRLSDVPSVGVVAATMSVSAVMTLPWALLTWPEQLPSTRALASVALLGLLCSAVAYLLFYRLIGVVGAGRASLINYVTPAVAVTMGVAVLAEPLHASTALGALLIVGGSWLATRRPAPPADRPQWSPAGRAGRLTGDLADARASIDRL